MMPNSDHSKNSASPPPEPSNKLSSHKLSDWAVESTGTCNDRKCLICAAPIDADAIPAGQRLCANCSPLVSQGSQAGSFVRKLLSRIGVPAA